MNRKEEEVEIDLAQLFRALLKKAWVILLTAAIFAGLALTYTQLFITPLYKARALMYVNNKAISIGETKVGISSGDLVASQSLVDTYTIILKTRSTLEEVIEEEGLDYTYEELLPMIEAAAVDSTEVFYIEVTSDDPREAEQIANALARILPEKISAIVEGTSVRIVDSAVEPAHKASPSRTKNTILGGLIGFVLACGAVAVLQVMDDEIHTSDYLLQNYDIPVLAVIPDLTSSGKHGEYGGYGSTGKGGRAHV